MGGILKCALSNTPDKTVINELKSKIMLEPLVDIIDKFEEILGDNGLYIPLPLFREHFKRYINQMLIEKIYILLLDNTADSKEVLKFELYILMVLLSKGSFEAKVNTIFNILCINEENTLFGQDLILLIKSSIYCIFKICKIPIPNDDEIKTLLTRHFPLVLTDEFFEITYEDFNDWISKDDEVHSFLVEFFDMQTRYNAMKSFIKYLSEFELIFDMNKIPEEPIPKTKAGTKKSAVVPSTLFSQDDIPVDSELNTFCPVESIMKEIGTLLQKIDPKATTIFLELIDPETTGLSRKDRYLKAIKGVCLFMSVDKDMSHSLSQSELGTLIWLLSGEEPTDANLNATIEKLDANGDSAIELGEWLEFLGTKDSKGKRVMNYALKQKFDMYDEDGNGTISIDELEKMIIDTFSDLINKTEGANQNMSRSIVLDLAKIIMQKMDINSSNNLDWAEFKEYLQVASAMEEKIADYIEKYL